MPNPRQDEPTGPVTGYKALDKVADAAEAAAQEATETVKTETRAFADRAASQAAAAAEANEALLGRTERAAAAALKMIDRAAPDPAAVTRASEAVAATMRDLSGEWLQAFGDQATRNLQGVARLAECRSPLDLVRAQAELARQRLGDSVALAQRLNVASLRAFSAIVQESAAVTRKDSR